MLLSKGKDIEGVGSEDLVNYIDVGLTYYFNKNMNAFVDYKINQLKSDNKLGINDGRHRRAGYDLPVLINRRTPAAALAAAFFLAAILRQMQVSLFGVICALYSFGRRRA